MNPLDFVYETSQKDYVLYKYKTDEQLVQKIQTGKGDEETRYKDLGDVIYTELVFGGTTPTIPQQDYIYGDNDLLVARACRFQIEVGN